VTSRTRRLIRGLLGVLAAAVCAVFAVAGPAAAHTEVSAEPARAGASDAVLTFTAEAESSTAGITSLQVLLPAGLTPSAVGYLSGPAGWALRPTADGYTVSGPALPVGEDARYRVEVAKLPAATVLAFKTLQTYSDGRTDRWIDLPTPGGPEPDHPAPVLTLAPAVSSPTTTPTPTTTPSPTITPTPTITPGTTPPAAVAHDDGGPPAVLWALIAVAVVAAAVAAAWMLRRRAAGRN
jgi:uncharacterized protein YcnI